MFTKSMVVPLLMLEYLGRRFEPQDMPGHGSEGGGLIELHAQ